LVLRAIGPLDRIVQAAGRCNREGRVEAGTVILFDPAEGGAPPGAYQTGTDLTRTLLRTTDIDLHDPAVYQRYFRDLYSRVSRDARNIQDARRRLDYTTVARTFRLIDDDTESVVVMSYWSDLPDGTSVSDAVSRLRARNGNPRLLLRALQPLIVSVRSRVLRDYELAGLVTPIVDGLWQWHGDYDPVRGLVGDRRDPEALVV
jgi:CRISPR-associated endonuclease/helicase Cas3